MIAVLLVSFYPLWEVELYRSVPDAYVESTWGMFRTLVLPPDRFYELLLVLVVEPPPEVLPPTGATRSAQDIPGGVSLVSPTACTFMYLGDPEKSVSTLTFERVVVLTPVQSGCVTTVLSGYATGAPLSARSSAQVPPS
jgi:hypothetical protein